MTEATQHPPDKATPGREPELEVELIKDLDVVPGEVGQVRGGNSAIAGPTRGSVASK